MSAAQAQTRPATAPAQPEAQAPADALGRQTPRGTVIGFLTAARRDEDETARQYLDTSLNGAEARVLAHQLFVVLDARLPARLSRVSDVPDGSRSNPLRPELEILATISSASGDVDLIVEQVTRGSGRIWLFSQPTLRAVPALYEEVTLGWGEGRVPRFLTGTRVAGVRLFEWLAVLLGLPFFYLLTVLLNRILTPLVRTLWRRALGRSTSPKREALPTPVRLLFLAFAIQWFLASLPTPLLVRVFWSNLASVLLIAGFVWLLIFLNGEAEGYLRRHFPRSNLPAAATLLRLLRRLVDLLVFFGGVMVMLRHFGIDPTPALAGLGVGGIAVALAAQKTLENVIAGASLVFDQAVRTGDFLKIGELQGTVEHIGLRSTRLRTLDRTVVSVPNGQIAAMSLETISARDKFWFHPVVGIRCDTLPQQLREVVHGIRRLLEEHSDVDRESVRVRFIRMGEFSLDIDVFAYVRAADWSQYLEIQEQLLFSVTDVIEAAGTKIAFRGQPMYLASLGEASARPPS